MSYFQDVVQFHCKFGIQYQGPPRALPEDLFKFRIKRLADEHCEYLDAVAAGIHKDQLDALVDLVYIALGNAHLHGWDFDEAWKRVHATNMSKERVSVRNPGKYGHFTDIVKPAGWSTPQLDDLV